jgi:RNA recognition motif-containing protein
MDEHSFQGTYNLVYVPVDLNSGSGFGYAFINFSEAAFAEEFIDRLNGFKVSEHICEVTWSSAHQGLDAHVRRYRNSPVMHPDVPDALKPAIFEAGERVPFPPPTKKLRAPKLRK